MDELVSGLYELSNEINLPNPTPILQPASTQELRLDVDGRYPLMRASGTFFFSIAFRTHWIANLTNTGLNSWTGDIWYKDGDTASFPYTNLNIEVQRSPFPDQRSATVTFSVAGVSNRALTYKYKSPDFHAVEFEFDFEESITPLTEIDTHAHPNRPATLLQENLSIETVYQRTGFAVTKSRESAAIAGLPPGLEARWSDNEMHDAMQIHWSRFANRPQSSMWVLFASIHEQGESLGGIMFDDIGSNHRQGTALFYNSFISQPPTGDPAPTAWVNRMRFWTAVHEMGHAFNLAHSWQKALGNFWIPLANEPEALSFMNYPYHYPRGEQQGNGRAQELQFFSKFEYRFSDAELLFMRHAPFRFVQQGNADWFDNHAFEQAKVSLEPSLNLELRVNRQQALFEFLEPVVLELKLTNISSQPQLISDKLLSELDHMIVIIKKDSQPARQFASYAQYCWKTQLRVLMPGESTYESLFASVGKGGWEIAEPGYYTIQVALHQEDTEEDLVSNPLRLRIAPPQSYDEEFLAQDFFSEDVGRILTFDGSQVLVKGNDTLREVSTKLSDRAVAFHAEVALACASAKEYKILDLDDPNHPKIKVISPHVEEARQEFGAALTDRPAMAARSLGHIDYKDYVDRFSNWLHKQGDVQGAVDIQDKLLQTLSERNVTNRVLDAIKARRDAYKQ
ncbi:hypothetical protein [Gloeocapsopsis sp. IPPAS B-1203]|uniref:hypothetical protein n=1 Tax=Gloeocapsopsis sp. IPPAS B-1203 TaxID=2049454 RepID=UPI000C179BF8|nr:hypothetical protein [Gloeocapsopsis sp. IPPAS B-1203]PIG94414.1 hypothetical protein CSQ79_03740 [Gloeocapsopsis sp. IPPAS B-1203]